MPCDQYRIVHAAGEQQGIRQFAARRCINDDVVEQGLQLVQHQFNILLLKCIPFFRFQRSARQHAQTIRTICLKAVRSQRRTFQCINRTICARFQPHRSCHCRLSQVAVHQHDTLALLRQGNCQVDCDGCFAFVFCGTGYKYGAASLFLRRFHNTIAHHAHAFAQHSGLVLFVYQNLFLALITALFHLDKRNTAQIRHTEHRFQIFFSANCLSGACIK